MKRKFVILFLILMFSQINLFASDMLDFVIGMSNSTKEVISDTKAIANYQKDGYKKQISNLILEIPEGTSKKEFLEDNKISPWGPAFGNLLIGFGVGSKWQGNISSSIIQKNVDSIAWSVGLGVPVLCLATGLLFLPIFYAKAPNTEFKESPLYIAAISSFVIGSSVSLINRTIGIISAFNYANKYNSELENQLQLAIIPSLNGNVSVIGKISLD